MEKQMLLDSCAKCVSKRETKGVGNGETRTIETHNQFVALLDRVFLDVGQITLQNMYIHIRKILPIFSITNYCCCLLSIFIYIYTRKELYA